MLEMRKVMSSGLIQGRNNKEVFCWDLVFSLACQQPAGHSFEEPFQIILKFHAPMETRRRELVIRRGGEDRKCNFNINRAKRLVHTV